MIVVDLRDVVAIDRAVVLTVLLAHLRVSDQQAQLLILPGRSGVQKALEAIHGPFTYADPDDCGLLLIGHMQPERTQADHGEWR
jgi:hypothetical protein